ncbi:MAG: adenylate cyclase class 1, partial [Gammaproteobacteria bacterium]
MPSSEACWGGRSISRISTQRAHTDPPNELEPATETIVLDARDLKTIRERFRQINNERLKRVVAALHGPQRDFLSLLPLLFHTNHPMLPGFAGKSVPFGLAEYAPTNSTLNAARRLTRSFEFKRRAGRSVDILALYLMGSSGTVAYSRKSDFDVWVCHRDELSAEAVGELTRKTDAIAQWAETLGLEVHFFNLSAKAFGAGKDEALSSESSGSAQHYLLLDEFYRTALLVSGRYPAWWLVPPQYERQYHAVVETIRERRLCGDNEFIDFGTVSELPASEFVGAALWQLTKAIESPHKSLLKIMLIEAYASEFPDPDLLSNRFKRAVYDGERSLNRLDPYAVFVQKVEDYLRVAHDDDRLELARQCFYLKVNVPLSKATARATTDWRVELVQEVVDEWDWDDEKIAKLDNRSSWRIGEVMDERNAMVRALIHAYKFIARFSRKQSETQGVSERDMTILGRKLFAAFEQKAGKINIVNRGL